METDASLSRPSRRLTIETKFYPRCLQLRHGKATLRSTHLYQLFAYLRNLAARNPDEQVDGLLLYPAVGRRLKFDYEMHGHKLRVCTVNLGQDWQSIRAGLLKIIEM